MSYAPRPEESWLTLHKALCYPNPTPTINSVKETPAIYARELDFKLAARDAYPVIAAGADYSYWLDSARGASSMSNFSYMGVVPDWAPVIRIERAGTGRAHPWRVLERALQSAPVPVHADAAGLPEGLRGGYVGFFGYEARTALEPHTPGFRAVHAANTPDALWLPAVRYVVFEHATGRTWLVGDEPWLDHIEPALRTAAEGPPRRGSLAPGARQGTEKAPVRSALSFTAPPRDEYLDKVRACLREIYEGNSYEVCLSAQTSARTRGGTGVAEHLSWYAALREHNPAPYAAYLRCKDFSVLSSSPERFLLVDGNGAAETKPIKGTVPRGATPGQDDAAARWLAADPKTRAENLMIVDLLRNDLSRVSHPGSVAVPALAAVESYATVHQLVSTVSSRLLPGVSAVAAAAACFPGGSMTGAPKPRTMSIIEALEGRARGVYSGALGFFSADGPAHLSIVIRTLIAHDDGLVTLAAGGAVVADSTPEAEYEEMLTKLAAALPPSVGTLSPGRSDTLEA